MADSGRDIPEHVLFDILAWLPVISLLRFKCVCKSWCALVESSAFITQHLHGGNSSEDVLIVYGCERSTYTTFYMLIYGNEYEKFSKLDYMQTFITPNGILCNGMIGSCNGIVCGRTCEIGGYTLCNPAMKQLRHLPKPSFPTPPVEAGSRYEVLGFGFDVKTNDYKVVRVLFYADEPGSGIHNTKIVEVYSKSTDSWRTLHKKGASLPFNELDLFPQATNKNGKCFWTADSNSSTCNCKLVSFDLNDEVFGSMSLPEGGLHGKARGLDFLNDNLVYIKGVERDIYEYDSGHKFFEIWMLHEFGVEESWNKIYKIGPIFYERCIRTRYYCPIRLSKNGEYVLLIRDYDGGAQQLGELHLYKLRNPDNKCPLILPLGWLAYELFHYNESLVSIKS